MANEYTYRAEPVGALLRPGGAIDNPTPDELDGYVRQALQMQRAAGLGLATDGEYRRHDLAAALAASSDAKPLTLDEATFAIKESRLPVKVSLPSPSAALETLRHKAGAPFDEAATEASLATAILREVNALFDAGVAVVQLNGAAYGALLDAGENARIATLSELDKKVLSQVKKPNNARLALRIGRPGPSPSWTASPALEVLLNLPADRFLLDIGPDVKEFSFISAAAAGAMIVLGLIESSKAAHLNPDAVLTQIDKAADILDGDRLALSPRGGFLPTSGLTWADQKRVLEHVTDVATRWWGFAM